MSAAGRPAMGPGPRVAGRARCTRCGLPASTCVCRFATPVDNGVEVLLLQHPHEVHEAKNSARLLGLCLQRCRLVVGEAFEPSALNTLLHPPGLASVLLYPADSPADPVTGPVPDGTLKPGAPAAGRIQLVVLDGTWRKSLKMLKSNPLLQTLPRCVLRPSEVGRYGLLRKARRATQMSTLEAACEALAQLEGDGARYAPMLQAFDRFVVDRIARAPSSARSSGPAG